MLPGGGDTDLGLDEERWMGIHVPVYSTPLGKITFIGMKRFLLI
jgi:hypothetical protein